MPNFDRATLAKFLPDPRSIAAFESLNKAVDVTLPAAIEDGSNVAALALIAAQQALAQLVDVMSRLGGLELLPVTFSDPPGDNLTPPSIAFSSGDDLAPASIESPQPNDLAPAFISSTAGASDDLVPHI